MIVLTYKHKIVIFDHPLLIRWAWSQFWNLQNPPLKQREMTNSVVAFGRSKHSPKILFYSKFNVDYGNQLCFAQKVQENGEKWSFLRTGQKFALGRIYSSSVPNVLTHLVKNLNFRFFAINHLWMGKDDSFNLQTQHFYLWSYPLGPNLLKI